MDGKYSAASLREPDKLGIVGNTHILQKIQYRLPEFPVKRFAGLFDHPAPRFMFGISHMVSPKPSSGRCDVETSALKRHKPILSERGQPDNLDPFSGHDDHRSFPTREIGHKQCAA